jgi:TonB family protein
MRGWIIGVCALLTAQAAQAQNGRLAFDCAGTRKVQDVRLEDPASNAERSHPLRTVFIIDEARDKILTYAAELAKYEEFCPSCKKTWSATSVTWSDDHTEMKYDLLWYKSTSEGRFDWQQGTAQDKSLLFHYDTKEKETGQTKEHIDYPRCAKIDIDTYDFESLSPVLQERAARAAIKKPAKRRAPLRKEPLRQDWAVQSLSDGAELRYLPLGITENDYPRLAAAAGVEGTGIVSLQVDTSGRLVSCTTAWSSGSPILDQQACRLYRERGRFELRGTTQPVTVQTAVQWVLMD